MNTSDFPPVDLAIPLHTEPPTIPDEPQINKIPRAGKSMYDNNLIIKRDNSRNRLSRYFNQCDIHALFFDPAERIPVYCSEHKADGFETYRDWKSITPRFTVNSPIIPKEKPKRGRKALRSKHDKNKKK